MMPMKLETGIKFCQSACLQTIIIFLSCFPACSFLHAQTQFVFSHITTDDGLSDNYINCVSQDNQGYIWISTLNGLQRFDGNKYSDIPNVKARKELSELTIFQIIKLKDGNFLLLAEGLKVGIFNPATYTYKKLSIRSRLPIEIKSNYAYHLYKDFHNRIFLCIHDHGILKLDEESNEFTDENPGIFVPKGWTVNRLFSDEKTGNYWIASDSGLAVYNDYTKALSYKHHNPKKIKALELNYPISDFFIDDQRRYWMVYALSEEKSYKEHILKYDETLMTTEIDPPGSVSGHPVQINDIIQTADGTVWIGEDESLISLLKGSQKFIQNRNEISTNYGIEFTQVNSFFEDRENNLWISTDRGLYVRSLKDAYVSNYLLLEKNVCLANSFVPVNPNEIFAGIWGKGVIALDSTLHLLDSALLPHPTMFNSMVRQMGTNNIWCGYEDGEIIILDADSKKIVRKIPQSTFQYSSIEQLATDKEGNVWIGTSNGKVFRCSTKKNPDVKDVIETADYGSWITSLFTDRQNNLWIGSLGNGLTVINVHTRKAIARYYKNIGHDSLSLNTVSSVCQYNDSIYFINYNGLNILNTRSRQMYRLNYYNGLINNKIRSMVLDQSNLLWISTLSGICSFDYQTNHFTIYNRTDGFLNSEDLLSSVITPEGRVFIGGVNSISSFRPTLLPKPKLPPPVTITNVTLFDHILPLDSVTRLKTLQLSHNENSFSISFASLTFLQKNKLTYYYKLDGADKVWIKADRSQLVNYSQLSPGNYVFMVQCTNEQGTRNAEITRLFIRIAPPFWATWWFIALSCIFTIILIHFIYKQRIEKLLAIERVRQKVARDLHDDIGSTLSTINILSSMARKKIGQDASKAGEYMEKISNNSSMMMESMDDIVWSINPVNDTMQKTITRMREFATNVLEAKEINIDFHMEATVLPLHLNMEQRRNFFLIFKEVINNAAKYSEASKVDISLFPQNGYLNMTIHDNGTGFDMNSENDGNGLVNMQKRAALLKGKLIVQSGAGQGTTTYLKFPV